MEPAGQVANFNINTDLLKVSPSGAFCALLSTVELLSINLKFNCSTVGPLLSCSIAKAEETLEIFCFCCLDL